MTHAEPHKIVLLENDRARRDYLKSMISGWGYRSFIFENASMCLDNLAPLDPDLVISGSLSPDKALRFINSLKLIKFNLPVLVFTGDFKVQDYIDANGFFDVQALKHNLPPTDIKTAIQNSLNLKGKSENGRERPLIIGNSPGMMKLKKLLPVINLSHEPVLIQGESGTGKELFARAIHFNSKRNGKPFLKLNAVELPYQLLEAELFGFRSLSVLDVPYHENGLFAVADKGTFFIKEIGAFPVPLQAKLLQILEKCDYPVVAEETGSCLNIRVIASTTHDLADLADKGLFRSDLYHRLNVLKLTIPPLRIREEDIPVLIDFFTDKFCLELGKSRCRISEATKNALCRYQWPENVKELADVIKTAVVNGGDEGLIERLNRNCQDIMALARARRAGDIETIAGVSNIESFLQKTNNYSLKNIRNEFMSRAEKRIILKALELANWNRKKAADLLDISYKSLLNKMKDFNLTGA